MPRSNAMPSRGRNDPPNRIETQELSHRSDDLAALVGIAQGTNPAFSSIAVECATLNACAMMTRYDPESAWAIDGEEAEAAVMYFQSVLDHCAAGLRGAGGPKTPTA